MIRYEAKVLLLTWTKKSQVDESEHNSLPGVRDSVFTQSSFFSLASLFHKIVTDDRQSMSNNHLFCPLLHKGIMSLNFVPIIALIKQREGDVYVTKACIR